jgi:hypothetical protein
VQEQLRHANISQTMYTHSYVLPNLQAKAKEDDRPIFLSTTRGNIPSSTYLALQIHPGFIATWFHAVDGAQLPRKESWVCTRLGKRAHVTEERNEEPQRGTTEGSSATTRSTTEQQTQEEQKSPPLNFRIAAIVLVLASLIFVVTMVVFAGLFKEATEVTTALGSLFTLMGTVVGAYFGIKSTQDTADKATKQVEEAHKRENAALGALDSNKWVDLRRDRLL